MRSGSLKHTHPDTETGRYCPECGTYKPKEEFRLYRGALYRICKTHMNAHAAASRAKQSPEHRKAANRRAACLRYGITPEDYTAMAEAQDYKCKICGRPESDCPRGVLCIDHDHGTGHVRFLLCQHCNSGLGHFFDDPDLLEAAAAALRGIGYGQPIRVHERDTRT